MHYILNTAFRTTSGGLQNQRIGGPTRFGQQQQQHSSVSLPKGMKPNEMYILTYIKKIDDAVEYHFKSSKGEIVYVTFADCLQADKFIASMKQEMLPDYTEIYSKNKT